MTDRITCKSGYLVAGFVFHRHRSRVASAGSRSLIFTVCGRVFGDSKVENGLRKHLSFW